MSGGERESAGGWREIGNKLATYRLVRVSGQRVRRLAGLPLAESIASLYRLDPASTVFRLERLAYERTLAACRRDPAPREILGRADAAGPPEKSLILLHVGLGMGLAEVVLPALRPASPATLVDSVLQRFLGLGRASSWPGYERAVVEAFGVMVRMFHAPLIPAVDRGLQRIDPELAGCLWHGAGRALYFRLAGFLAGSMARNVEHCRREPPPRHRLDALAGLSFAVAMVNLRHPAIVERLLAEVADRPAEAAAFTHGVAASLVARRHTTPEDPTVHAFLDYRPAGAESRRSERWERLVRRPCSDCLERIYPRLLADRRLDVLARYSPLADLVEC